MSTPSSAHYAARWREPAVWCKLRWCELVWYSYSITEVSSPLEVVTWRRSNQQIYVSYQSRIAMPFRPTNQCTRRRAYGNATHPICLPRNRFVTPPPRPPPAVSLLTIFNFLIRKHLKFSCSKKTLYDIAGTASKYNLLALIHAIFFYFLELLKSDHIGSPCQRPRPSSRKSAWNPIDFWVITPPTRQPTYHHVSVIPLAAKISGTL